MPVLSIDYSRGSATALLVNDDLSYKVSRLPLMSPNIFYANRPSKTQEFLRLLSELEEELDIKIQDKLLIYAATTTDLGVSVKNCRFCSKDEAFRSLYPIDFRYFSHLHVGSSAGVFFEDKNFAAVKKELFFDEKEETLKNYFENLNLYPYIEASSDRDIYEELYYLKEIARTNCPLIPQGNVMEPKTIIFSTTRTVDEERLLARFMLLALDSLCSFGFYNFKFDFSNFLGSSSALSFFENELFQKISMPKFISLGSVVNLADDLTCEIDSGTGTIEDFRVEKGELFTRPLTSGESVVLKVGSKRFGAFEKVVPGGVFGIVLDTRDKDKEKDYPLAQKKLFVKSWEDQLVSVSRAF
ncbi:MAG: hypothetical protein AAB443_04225 [Patescibacteria group bacterium]